MFWKIYKDVFFKFELGCFLSTCYQSPYLQMQFRIIYLGFIRDFRFNFFVIVVFSSRAKLSFGYKCLLALFDFLVVLSRSLNNDKSLWPTNAGLFTMIVDLS